MDRFVVSFFLLLCCSSCCAQNILESAYYLEQRQVNRSNMKAQCALIMLNSAVNLLKSNTDREIRILSCTINAILCNELFQMNASDRCQIEDAFTNVKKTISECNLPYIARRSACSNEKSRPDCADISEENKRNMIEKLIECSASLLNTQDSHDLIGVLKWLNSKTFSEFSEIAIRYDEGEKCYLSMHELKELMDSKHK